MLHENKENIGYKGMKINYIIRVHRKKTGAGIGTIVPHSTCNLVQPISDYLSVHRYTESFNYLNS